MDVAESQKMTKSLQLPISRPESSKVLWNVMRDYQPAWRIRSRMSSLY